MTMEDSALCAPPHSLGSFQGYLPFLECLCLRRLSRVIPAWLGACGEHTIFHHYNTVVSMLDLYFGDHRSRAETMQHGKDMHKYVPSTCNISMSRYTMTVLRPDSSSARKKCLETIVFITCTIASENPVFTIFTERVRIRLRHPSSRLFC
jgi:hypothetical protein